MRGSRGGEDEGKKGRMRGGENEGKKERGG